MNLLSWFIGTRFGRWLCEVFAPPPKKNFDDVVNDVFQVARLTDWLDDELLDGRITNYEYKRRSREVRDDAAVSYLARFYDLPKLEIRRRIAVDGWSIGEALGRKLLFPPAPPAPERKPTYDPS